MEKENVIAHRGYWLELSEKNSVAAFERAVAHGFGIETDFRDLDGELVISHDMPRRGEVISAADFFALCAVPPDWRGILALNVKADGLQRPMREALEQAGLALPHNFVFDMSVPDMLGYAKLGMPLYTRQSEYEHEPSMLEQAQGIWIDNFSGNFDQVEQATRWLTQGYKVAFVSPELHGRAHHSSWNAIGQAGLHRDNRFSICTDLPVDALNFFQGLR